MATPPVNHGYRIAGVCRTEGWAERADRSLMQISSCCRRLLSGGQDVQTGMACLLDAHAPQGIGFSSRRRRGRSATASGSAIVTTTMTMSLKGDKTGPRRHSALCLLRRGEKGA